MQLQVAGSGEPPALGDFWKFVISI